MDKGPKAGGPQVLDSLMLRFLEETTTYEP